MKEPTSIRSFHDSLREPSRFLFLLIVYFSSDSNERKRPFACPLSSQQGDLKHVVQDLGPYYMSQRSVDPWPLS